MVSLTIPDIFSRGWFWLSLMAIIAIIHYFWGKTPTPPKPSKFATKHKKTICKATDILIICLLSVFFLLLVFPAIKQIFNSSSAPPEIRSSAIHFALAAFLIVIIVWCGISGMLIGMLSVFHSNLTKAKRIFLLIICLLPLLFSVIVLLIEPGEEPWVTVALTLICSVNCWIINAPAIFLGKHFFPVAWAIMRKLRWVSGEYQG